MATQAHQASEYSQKFGIVDFGSGTLRIVVYGANDKGELTKLFTDKANCALGESVAKNGRLSKASQTYAIDSIKRFQSAAAAHGVDTLHAFGTSALRRAKNQKAFLEAVRDQTGVDVDVISGKEEAKLQAIGSSLGGQNSKGRISADLGRSSLDIARVKNVSFMPKSVLLGCAIVASKGDGARKYIKRKIKELPHYPKGRKMHLVGGSWRRMAKAYLIEQGVEKPRDILHGFDVDAKEFMTFLDTLGEMPADMLRDTYEIEESRIKHIPAAVETLRQLSDHLKTSEFVFSMFGVREGYLLSKVINTRAADITIVPEPPPANNLELAAQ
ncbi:MAG: hypothetical protein GW778_08435 [Alphaproteobacteria bacterium]|nr:hypothetical protein [Alphaproteobacteria bacterium]